MSDIITCKMFFLVEEESNKKYRAFAIPIVTTDDHNEVFQIQLTLTGTTQGMISTIDTFETSADLRRAFDSITRDWMENTAKDLISQYKTINTSRS